MTECDVFEWNGLILNNIINFLTDLMIMESRNLNSDPQMRVKWDFDFSTKDPKF